MKVIILDGARGFIAMRPCFSALDLGRFNAVGFVPYEWERELAEYLQTLGLEEG